MEKVIIIRYCELYLKGKNRGFFERQFAINIERALKGLRHELRRRSGRYLVEAFDAQEIDEIVTRLKKVFGIHTLSVALKGKSDMDNIYHAAEQVAPQSVPPNRLPRRAAPSRWKPTAPIRHFPSTPCR